MIEALLAALLAFPPAAPFPHPEPSSMAFLPSGASVSVDDLDSFASALEERMAGIRVLSRAGLQRVDGKGNVIYYYEPPAGDTGARKAEILEVLDPWHVKMESIFDELYGRPMALARKPGHEGHAVCILQSRGQLKQFADTVGIELGTRDRVVHDPELQLSVTFLGDTPLEGALSTRRKALMEGHVLALLDARTTAVDGLESWLRHGVSGYLSETNAKDPSGLAVQTVNPRWLNDISLVLQPAAREVLLPSIAELPDFRTEREVEDWTRPRYARRSGKTLGPGWAPIVHRAHGPLMVHYLHRGSGGRFADGVPRYLAKALAGEGGVQALENAFGITDLVQIDDGLVAFGRERYDAIYPQRPIAALDPIFETSGEPKPDLRAGNRKRGRTTNAAAPAKSTAAQGGLPAITVPAAGASVAVGSALELVATGRLAEASAALEATLAGSAQGPGRDLAEQTLERIKQFTALRRAALEAVAKNGKKMSLELEQGKLLGKIESIEEDRILLGKNRLKLKELVLDEVPAAVWANLMFDRKRTGLDLDPAMLLPLAIEGPEAMAEAPKRLKVTDEWRDAANFQFAEARADMDLHAALKRIGRFDANATGAELEALLSALDTLLINGDQGTATMDDMVSQRRASLLKIGAHLIGRSMSERGLADLVHAKVESRGDDVYTLTWDFETPEQLQDFETVAPSYAYPDQPWVEELAADNPLSVSKGWLQGSGGTVLRTPFEFEGTEAEWSTVVDPQEGQRMNFFLALNMHTNHRAVQAQSLNYLLVYEDGASSTDGKPVEIVAGQQYVARLVHKGEGWTLSVDGDKRASFTGKGPKRGYLVIGSLGSQRLRMDRVQVTGKIDAKALDGLRAARAKREANARGWGISD